MLTWDTCSSKSTSSRNARHDHHISDFVDLFG